MKNVAIVYGGFSSEWEISRLSALTVLKYTDRSLYKPFMVKIAENGWVVEFENTEIPIDKNDFSFSLDGAQKRFDVVYNIIHGTPGEDGKLLAYFDMLGIPYTGNSYYASGITFHKYWCNQLLKQFGIKSADAVTYMAGEDRKDLENHLSYPCFVKPNDAGSSFGVSKVNSPDELDAALDSALKESDLVIIEAFLDGTEVSCGIVEINEKLIALPPTEIVSDNDFFDYAAKYLGESQEITPARISETETSKVQHQATKIFKLLHLKGIARADFILVNGEPYLIEVNTVPGLSEASILPQQCAEKGIGLGELVNSLIRDAVGQ